MKSVRHENSILSLSWPIFIELILQMLVGNADQIMVGWYDQDLVGAIGNANQIVNLLLIVFSVICTAATILISQYLGAKSTDRLRETYTVSLLANLIFGLAVSAVLIFLCKPIYRMMSVPVEIFDEAVVYIRIIGAGMVFQAVYLTFTAFFRSSQLMKQTMLVSVLVNVMNIGCNALLINGLFGLPALGVAGAAISSGLSRVAGVVVIALMFRRYFGAQAISSGASGRFRGGSSGDCCTLASPREGNRYRITSRRSAYRPVCNRFELFVINTRVYANMFAMLSYMFALAVAQAAQVVVARYMGAGDTESTDRCVRRTMYASVCISALVSTLLYLVCRAAVSDIHERCRGAGSGKDHNAHRDTAGAGPGGEYSDVPGAAGLRGHKVPDNDMRDKRVADGFRRRGAAVRAAGPGACGHLDSDGLRRMPARGSVPLALAHQNMEPHKAGRGIQLIDAMAGLISRHCVLKNRNQFLSFQPDSRQTPIQPAKRFVCDGAVLPGQGRQVEDGLVSGAHFAAVGDIYDSLIHTDAPHDAGAFSVYPNLRALAAARQPSP